jgi:hypothetical protein
MAMAQISKFFLSTIQNFLTLSTFPFEAILIMFLTMPKSGVNRRDNPDGNTMMEIMMMEIMV